MKSKLYGAGMESTQRRLKKQLQHRAALLIAGSGPAYGQGKRRCAPKRRAGQCPVKQARRPLVPLHRAHASASQRRREGGTLRRRSSCVCTRASKKTGEIGDLAMQLNCEFEDAMTVGYVRKRSERVPGGERALPAADEDRS